MSAQFSGGGGVPIRTFYHCSMSRGWWGTSDPLHSTIVQCPGRETHPYILSMFHFQGTGSLSLVFYLCSLSRLVVPLYSWLFRLLILIKHELPCDKTNIVTQRCPGSKSYSHRLPAFKRFTGKLKLRS